MLNCCVLYFCVCVLNGLMRLYVYYEWTCLPLINYWHARSFFATSAKILLRYQQIIGTQGSRVASYPIVPFLNYYLDWYYQRIAIGSKFPWYSHACKQSHHHFSVSQTSSVHQSSFDGAHLLQTLAPPTIYTWTLEVSLTLIGTKFCHVVPRTSTNYGSSLPWMVWRQTFCHVASQQLWVTQLT